MAGAWVRRVHAQGPPAPGAGAGEVSATAEPMARSTNHATLRDKVKGNGGGGEGGEELNKERLKGGRGGRFDPLPGGKPGSKELAEAWGAVW